MPDVFLVPPFLRFPAGALVDTSSVGFATRSGTRAVVANLAEQHLVWLRRAVAIHLYQKLYASFLRLCSVCGSVACIGDA